MHSDSKKRRSFLALLFAAGDVWRSAYSHKKGRTIMSQIFGYQNFSGKPSGIASHVPPGFQTAREYIQDDASIFWNAHPSKQERESIYESSDALVMVLGDIYLTDAFSAKYPELKNLPDQDWAAKVAHLYGLHG